MKKLIALFVALLMVLSVTVSLAETKITVNGTSEVRVSADTAIISLGVNPGSVYAEPILTVYGSGDITLMVGTAIVELENISGSIILDCALKEAYLGSTLLNDHMTGDFPVLKPGANAISWTGTVTTVVVRPNWRYL